MKIALYSSNMGAGKSTVADYLVEIGFKRVKFARVLKDMLHVFLTNFVVDPNEYLEGSKKESTIPGLNVTARYLMQTMGHDWGRVLIDPKLWIKTEFVNMFGQNIVIDDMRYENEYDYLRNKGFIMVKLVGRGELVAPHDSEQRLDNQKFDYVIENNGSVEELIVKVVELL